LLVHGVGFERGQRAAQAALAGVGQVLRPRHRERRHLARAEAGRPAVVRVGEAERGVRQRSGLRRAVAGCHEGLLRGLQVGTALERLADEGRQFGVVLRRRERGAEVADCEHGGDERGSSDEHRHLLSR
jgi:hypothetical protein